MPVELALFSSIVRIFSAPPTTKLGHRESYQNTINMAESVRKEVGLGVRVVLGPHPAAFAHQFINWVEEDGNKGREKAVQNYLDSIDEAAKFYHEGKAHAIGEVGRPHWEVSERYGICLTNCSLIQ